MSLEVLAVHRQRAPDGFQFLEWSPRAGSLFDQFDGRVLSDHWDPPRLNIVRLDERGNALAKSDFPSPLGSSVIAVSERALERIGDLLRAAVELLSARCNGDLYYLLNVQQIEDALDVPRSTIRRFPDGRILNIESYGFLPSVVEKLTIFKLRGEELRWVYFTAPAIARIEAAGLDGFGSVEVWRQSS